MFNSNEQKDVQKNLESMARQIPVFQSGGGYFPKGLEGSQSNPSSKFISLLLIVEVILALALAVVFVMKSGGKLKKEAKAPPGYEIIYSSFGSPTIKPKLQ